MDDSQIESRDSSLHRAKLLGLLVVAGSSLAFFLRWWNAYLPPTVGGEVLYMQLWTEAFLPYRDYFYHAPPGVPMLAAFIDSLTGPHLIGLAAFGMVLRIAATCALYGLLLRLARPMFAAVGVLTALFVSSTDISDMTHYYNHLGASLVLLGTCAGLYGADGKRFTNRLVAGLAGGCFAFAILSKQTMVFTAAGACMALVLLQLPRPKAGWFGWIFSIAAGGVGVFALAVAWLARHGIVADFLRTMGTASDGKGGIGRSLLRPIVSLFEPSMYTEAHVTLVALVFLGLMVLLWRRHERGGEHRRLAWLVWLVPIGMLVVANVGFLSPLWNARDVTLLFTAIGWWGCLAIVGLHLSRKTLREADSTGRTHIALGVLGFAVGYGCAVSWPLFENMAFPGLGLVVAVFLERPPSQHRERWVGAILIVAALAALTAGYRKENNPHSWGLWYEPPLTSPAAAVDHPAVWGMRISMPSAKLFNLVLKVARTSSQPGDRMYVFPNMAILYAIADRRPATYGLAHWVDICPEFLGREDAARLRARPPKIIVLRDDPVEFITQEETLYRAGKRSSVRDVLAAVAKILPGYDRAAVYRSGVSPPIFVYVRKDGRKAPSPR